MSKTGEYNITLSYSEQNITSVLTIADTIPPTGTFETQPDFTQLGEQTVSIKLSEASGNEIVLSAKLLVIEDTVAPVCRKEQDKKGYIPYETIREQYAKRTIAS